ncbi:MAG: hypothetical protein ICV60_18740 [Pyrinomonadaceae bacterium]|nr:hypothetical protein [Pyrinomonadaceae bacterium]
MAEEKNRPQEQGTDATAAKQAGTQPPRNDITEQRGGPQANQITGETDKGAKTEANENRNPTGDAD